MTIFDDITIPIVVDLDGTLTYVDTLGEGIRKHARSNPLSLFQSSRPKLKKAISDSHFDMEHLPWNDELLSWLQEEKEKGRTLVLATAAHEGIARRVQAHLKLFDIVLASSDEHNLKGVNKRDALAKLFGTQYIYIGDAQADKCIWEHASGIGLAGKGERFLNWAKQQNKPYKLWGAQKSGVLKALRPHQWVKNSLIFLPIISSHSWNNTGMVMGALLMLFAFSLLASATYLINDMVDLEDDRTHPRKQNRPLASGRLSLIEGFLLIIILGISSITLGFSMNLQAGLILLLYAALTLLYSFHLKTKPIVDIATLAGLYTLRIGAGIVATGLFVTPWIMMFSFLLFLSLATAKRLGELLSLGDRQTSRRGYSKEDEHFLLTLGLSTGLSSVVVFGLYMTEPTIQALYAIPNALFGGVLALTLWLMHLWFVTHKGKMTDDPIVFAFKDKTSLLLGSLIFTSFIIAA